MFIRVEFSWSILARSGPFGFALVYVMHFLFVHAFIPVGFTVPVVFSLVSRFWSFNFYSVRN